MTQREQARLIARQELARRYFADYVTYSHRGLYRHARHTKYLCEHLEPVLKIGNQRIMIFMPPRHGKSMTVTETLPSYFLLRNPDKRVIVASYGDALAQRFGRYNRQKVTEYGPSLFNVNVSANKSSMTEWDIDGHRGGMLAVGIGGSVTGQGADLLIIDDPVRNALEAESETYRERVWNEYQYTLRSRVHAGGSIIVILTRWHADDLAGRLLNPEYGDPSEWNVINLPAIAESGDMLGRDEGEPLWPKGGYDEAWAEVTKREVGSRVWASLYQQHPSPPEGNIFNRDWWKYYTELPEHFDIVIQSWDCTFRESDTSDYVAGHVWGKRGADVYLIDRVKRRMDFVKTLDAIRAMTKRHPNARKKLVEAKANGDAVISALRREISGLTPVEPKGGKVARANAATPEIEAGNVYLPSPAIAPWITDFVEECSAFPNGMHDDDVDAMTQALNHLYRPVNKFVNVRM